MSFHADLNFCRWVWNDNTRFFFFKFLFRISFVMMCVDAAPLHQQEWDSHLLQRSVVLPTSSSSPSCQCWLRFGVTSHPSAARQMWPRWLTSAPEQVGDLCRTVSTLDGNPNYSRAETLTFFLESEELRLFLFSLRPLCKHCDCRLQCVNVENAYGIVPYSPSLSR